MSRRRCMHVDQDTTREDLLARGVSPEAADELLAFRDRLQGKPLAEVLGAGDGQEVRQALDEMYRGADEVCGRGPEHEGAETPPSRTPEQGGAG